MEPGSSYSAEAVTVSLVEIVHHSYSLFPNQSQDKISNVFVQRTQFFKQEMVALQPN